MNRRIKFSDEEIEVLGRITRLSRPSPTGQLGTAVKGTGTILDLSDEEADDLREACLEAQQIEGFDREYRLTDIGRSLQTMIDKLDR